MPTGMPSNQPRPAHSFEVYCERLAGQADPYLVVLDDKDNRIAELDDFGIRDNAFDGHTRNVSGIVNLTAKKKYKVLVQDRYKRGGPALSVRADDPQGGTRLLPRGDPLPEPGTGRHHRPPRRCSVPGRGDPQNGRLQRADHDHRRGSAEGIAAAPADENR